MLILIHTSKTMRPAEVDNQVSLSRPVLLDKAKELADYLKTLDAKAIEKTMHVSNVLALTTEKLIDNWNDDPKHLRAAIDSYLGDIYSGLQVADFSDKDRTYANNHLRILSGLYGVLKPLDGIYPYRFELGYKVPDPRYRNLYSYWGSSIVESLPKTDTIIDLTAVEYGKTVTDFVETVLDSTKIITPRFLTISPKTGEPIFVVVHAKIARGAFAHWMIKHRIENIDELKGFNEIGYRYDARLSTDAQPVFVCQTFEGLGLSVRLT